MAPDRLDKTDDKTLLLGRYNWNRKCVHKKVISDQVEHQNKWSNLIHVALSLHLEEEDN